MFRLETMADMRREKKIFRQWSSESMAKAIEAVREKRMGWKKATVLYKVPKTTLMRLAQYKYGNPTEAAKAKIGRPTILTRELEDELVKYCSAMKATFFGLTRLDLRSMAFKLAERHNVEHRFSKRDMAGKKWVSLFLKRHTKYISVRKRGGTTLAKELGFNRENVNNFFNYLISAFRKHHYPPNRIFNVDGSALAIDKSQISHIINVRGQRRITTIKPENRKTLISIIACMSASGNYIPPMVIFPRKNITSQLTEGAPPGTIFEAHPSGWIQMDLFTKWFKYFVEITKPTSKSPVLLILDGHYTHTRNIDVVDLAQENNVTIISLPPRSTHKMQPLDRTFIPALKIYYGEEIRQWNLKNQHNLTAFDVMKLFGKAYVKCQTAELAIRGFELTGIYPINKHVFNDAEFDAEVQCNNDIDSDIRDCKIKSEEESDDDSYCSDFNDESQHDDKMLCDINDYEIKLKQSYDDSNIIPDLITNTQCNNTMDIIEHNIKLENSIDIPNISDFNNYIPECVDKIDMVEHKIKLEDSTDISDNYDFVAETYFCNEMLQDNMKLEILTDDSNDLKLNTQLSISVSDFHKANESKIINAKTLKALPVVKTKKKNITTNVKANKRRTKNCCGIVQNKSNTRNREFNVKEETNALSGDESIVSLEPICQTTGSPLSDERTKTDDVCMFCGENWSPYRCNERWVRCAKCSDWAHEECSGAETDKYICDFCK